MTYQIENSRFDPPNMIVRSEPASRAWRIAKHFALRYSPRESAHVLTLGGTHKFRNYFDLGYDVDKGQLYVDHKVVDEMSERVTAYEGAKKVVEAAFVVRLLEEIERELKNAVGAAGARTLIQKSLKDIS